MENKKSLISTVLLCGGLLLAVCSIFCFFGSALKLTGENVPGYITTFVIGSVFAFMFGGNATGTITTIGPGGEIVSSEGSMSVEMAPILTVVFVFVIIAIILAIIAAVGLLTKKLDSKKVKILTCAVSVLMLVSAIMALASKNPIIDAQGGLEEATPTSLGSGLIAFAVLGFVSVAANVASIILNKQPKAAN